MGVTVYACVFMFVIDELFSILYLLVYVYSMYFVWSSGEDQTRAVTLPTVHIGSRFILLFVWKSTYFSQITKFSEPWD